MNNVYALKYKLVTAFHQKQVIEARWECIKMRADYVCGGGPDRAWTRERVRAYGELTQDLEEWGT